FAVELVDKAAAVIIAKKTTLRMGSSPAACEHIVVVIVLYHSFLGDCQALYEDRNDPRIYFGHLGRRGHGAGVAKAVNIDTMRFWQLRSPLSRHQIGLRSGRILSLALLLAGALLGHVAFAQEKITGAADARRQGAGQREIRLGMSADFSASARALS